MKISFFIDGLSKIEESMIPTLMADRLLKLNMSTSEIGKISKFLINKYSSKNRHYHHFGHILSIFKSFYSLENQIENRRVIEFAAIFHDIIYNPLRKDNELKSAAFAKKNLEKYLSKEEINLLFEIIISTAKHQPTVDSLDCKLFLDLDLLILAAEEETYQKYSAAIRKEYYMYPNFLYKKGRKKVLEHFLQRERIFFTEDIHKEFEEQARKNLDREIEELS